MTFDDSVWLLALALVPLIVVVAWRQAASRQRRVAVILRAVGVAALVLALAGPRVDSGGNTVDVAFLVDRSDSVGTADGAAADYIEEALAGRSSGDRSAIAVFGRDGKVEQGLAEDTNAGDIASVVDGSATDLARALRLAQGVLGSEHRRRVVVFTDGRQTEGDALAAAQELGDAGIRVDIVPLAAGQKADVLIKEVRTPGRLREGEAFDVIGILTNTGTDPVEVVLVTDADEVEIDRRTVTVPSGDSEVRIPQVADETGTVRYELRLDAGSGSLAGGTSTIPQNDIGRAAAQVDGPPKVLVIEGETDAGRDLAAALDSTGVPVDLRDLTTADVPDLDRLLDYDSVVLVDVPVEALGEVGMQALDTFVRDAGRGIVAIGGDDAYGMGNYDDTTLEDLLPVYARIRDPKRRPSVAEALVVDVSGSMAACHCREEGFAGGGEIQEGGINKTDITKEAVARAIDALASSDTVGVLAFNAEAKWVLPLQQVPASEVVDNALARLHPDGPTDVVNALDEAIKGLKDVDARLRHIVLFTDGFSEDPRMVAAASRAAEAGITLSVVATGEGTGEVLERMAAAGGGRFYPGRDLSSIPDIIVSEVQIAARPLISEGVFVPVVSANDVVVDDLEATPPLLGYVATTEKPTARTILRIGPENDPLLASWQAGAGTAVAWTSDVSPRWSQRWVTWDGFAGFWSDVVRSTFPVNDDAGFSTSATVTPDGVRVTVDSAETLPEGTTGTVTVTLPDGTRVTQDLNRTELDELSAVVPGGVEGVYGVTVELTGPDGRIIHRDVTTAIRTYSAEYALSIDDAGLLAQLASAGGGEFDLAAADVFSPNGLEPGRSSRSLWPWLALLALLTLPADVGLRRLRVERGDLRRLLRGRRDDTIGNEPGDVASTPAARLRQGVGNRPPQTPPPSTRPSAAPPTTATGPRPWTAPSQDGGPTPRRMPPPPSGPTRPAPARKAPVPAPRPPVQTLPDDRPPPPPPTSARRSGPSPSTTGSPPSTGAGRLLDARRRAKDTE